MPHARTKTARFATICVNLLAFLLLPPIGILLLLGKHAVGLPEFHPVVDGLLGGLILSLPLVHKFAPSTVLGRAWPTCQYIAAHILFWLLSLGIRAQLPRWHRPIFGFLTLVLLIGVTFSAWRFTRYYTTSLAAHTLLADIATFIDGTPLSNHHSPHARQLIERLHALPLCTAYYPSLDPIVAALEQLYGQDLPPASAAQPTSYPARMEKAIAILDGPPRGDSLDGELRVLFASRLKLAVAQVNGTPLPTVHELITELPPPPSSSSDSMFFREANGPLRRAHMARDEMCLALWSNIYIVLSQHYMDIEQPLLRQHNIPCRTIADLEDRTDELLAQLDAGTPVNPSNRVRTANNRLHFLIYRLQDTAQANRHGNGGPVAKNAAGAAYVNGETLLGQQMSSVAAMAATVPTPEAYLTLAEGHSLLAHSYVEALRRTPTADSTSCTAAVRELDALHDCILIALTLGWPREQLLSRLDDPMFLGWLWHPHPQEPAAVHACLQDARTRLARVLHITKETTHGP